MRLPPRKCGVPLICPFRLVPGPDPVEESASEPLEHSFRAEPLLPENPRFLPDLMAKIRHSGEVFE